MHKRWGQAAAKKERGHFEQRTSGKKTIATLAVVGWNNNSVVYIASYESSEPKRYVRRLNKIERKYIQEQKPH